MLGEKIGEEHGKVTGRRVVPGDAQMSFMKLEISFETEIGLYDVSGMNVGTYMVYERGPGQMYAEGQGIVMTAEGEGAIWNGHGVGTMGQDGTMNFAASVAFQTTAAKLSALNGTLVLVEHHADLAGNANSDLHEWKA